jgi:hypothetical protein
MNNEQIQTQTKPEMPDLEAKKIEAEIAEKKAETERKSVAVENYKAAMAVQTTFMNPSVWTQIRTMGKVFFESKAIPSSIVNEAQLIMVLQAGFEMGMTPVESLQSLYIVKGSINIYGKAVTKRLRIHGWRIEYKDESDSSCTAIVRRDDEEYTETYTYEMARKSGYVGEGKVGWKEGINRRLKLRYGALSILIKSYIPDVLGSAEDIKEVIEDVQIVKEPIATEQKGTPSQTVRVTSLAEKLAKSREKKEAEEKPIELTEVKEEEAKE